MCLSRKSSLNVYSPRPWLVFGGVTTERFCGLWACYSRRGASLSPRRSFPYTASFLQHEESECLIIPDNHFCLSCQYSVRLMCLCGSALHVFPERHTDWPSAAPSPHPPCGGLSCSAASGSERGIITPCPSAGSFLALVRITWSPQSVAFWAMLPTQGCRGAVVSALMRIATENRRPASQARHFPVATSPPIRGRSILYSQQPN